MWISLKKPTFVGFFAFPLYFCGCVCYNIFIKYEQISFVRVIMRKLLWALLIAFSVVSFISCAKAAPEPEDGMGDASDVGDIGDTDGSVDTGDELDIREILAFSPELVEIYDKISGI